jgi:Spy/CpxP family protein refolding chaperone
MKTIVRFSMMLALITTVAVIAAEAQPGKGRKSGRGYSNKPGFKQGHDSCRVQIRVADLTDALLLNKDQKEQILALHYKHMDEMKSIRPQYADDCMGAREAQISARKKLDAETKQVLNAGQQEKYDEFMAGRRSPGGRHHYRK